MSAKGDVTVSELPSDDELQSRWVRAQRLYHQGHLARRIALLECDKLEAAGVTEAGSDRLFPPTPIRRWLREEYVDASED